MTRFRTLPALVLACLWAVNVQASLSFDEPPVNLAHLSSHRRHARHQPVADGISSVNVRRVKRDSKRCRARDSPTSTPTPDPTQTTEQQASPKQQTPSPEQQQQQQQPKPEENPVPSAENTPAVHTQNAVAVGGLINVQSNCGDPGATKDITPTSGPNGNIDWLNCGVNDGGWNPPYVRIGDLITADLNTDGPFAACSDYIGLFYQYGGQFGIPPIMLAAFAMQESSCNPHTVGGAGEQGLMQLTWDKCGGAPGGNCQDPDYNIRTGAKYFADTLAGNNGDVLLTIGMYNGWQRGLTYGSATAAAHSGCCRCQNNLDYLHQFVNGWLQNINSYSFNPPLGKYFNLNIC